MGTERFYKPGSFYRIDDRTGFATRAERTQMEWNGLIVDKRVWEARQPQDFVKGVADNQTVPNARPRQPNPYLNTGPAEFEVYNTAPRSFLVYQGTIQVTHLTVVSAANFPSGF
jgi:hypothetical protein